MISAEFIYVMISAAVTFFFPLFSIPLNLFGLVFLKKTRRVFAFLLALSLALVAYAWDPPVKADLYRHHLEMGTISGYSITQLFKHALKELNFIQIFTEFIVSKTGNHDFLQLVIVLLGYYEMFWIVCDYVEKKNIRSPVVAMALIILIVSLKFIDFASGLWFYFAVINFALGVYLKYFRNTKKLHYLFYVISILSHISLLYIVIMVLLMKVIAPFKKANWISLVVMFLVFSGIGFLIDYAYTHFDFYLVTVLEKMYQSYFLQGRLSGLIMGWNLYLAIINIACGVLVTVLYQRHEKNEYNSFILVAAVSSLALMLQSNVFTRFAFLIVLLAIIPFMEIMNVKILSRSKLLVILCFSIMVGLNVSRQVEQIKEYDLLNNVLDSIIETGGNV